MDARSLRLRIVDPVGRDEFASYLFQPPVMTGWSARQIAEKLADELHDFVAESAFGWGQSRSAHDVLERLDQSDQSG